MMWTIILIIIAANFYGFIFIKSYYEKKNLSRDVRLQDICPNCQEYTIDTNLQCTNCGLNMDEETTITESNEITCPSCSSIFKETEELCPNCLNYSKITV